MVANQHHARPNEVAANMTPIEIFLAVALFAAIVRVQQLDYRLHCIWMDRVFERTMKPKPPYPK